MKERSVLPEGKINADSGLNVSGMLGGLSGVHLSLLSSSVKYKTSGIQQRFIVSINSSWVFTQIVKIVSYIYFD